MFNSDMEPSETLMSTLEWVVAVGAGLIGPLALVALIGCCIPRMHTVVRSIMLKQSPASVWATIAAFDRIPGWWPPCMMVERLHDRGGHAIYRQTFQYGRRKQQIEIEVLESVEGCRLVTQIGEMNGPFRGQWIYELSPTHHGCNLSLTEIGEVKNPFIRAMSRLMNKAQYVESYLGCLGAKFGEKVTLLS
jgi:hypothetical protein